MSSCFTSVSDGEVAKPLRLQRYTKKMTYARENVIFMYFGWQIKGFGEA